MMRRIVGAIGLMAMLAGGLGCSAVRDIVRPFEDDPVISVMSLAKETVVGVREEMFLPLHKEAYVACRESGGDHEICKSARCRTERCREWTRLDRYLTLAHNVAERGVKSAGDDAGREEIARGIGEEVISVLGQLSAIDKSRADQYARFKAALQAVVARLGR